MRAYSQDLRSRILSAVEEAQITSRNSTTFQVSQATITRYRKLLRETGTLATKPIPGRSPKKRVAGPRWLEHPACNPSRYHLRRALSHVGNGTRHEGKFSLHEPRNQVFALDTKKEDIE